MQLHIGHDTPDRDTSNSVAVAGWAYADHLKRAVLRRAQLDLDE
jgi:hypothetical protein